MQFNPISATTATTAASHYDVLGIPDTATFEEIKAAHREKARKHHPDKIKNNAKNGSNNNQQQYEFPDDEFLKVQTAWECLRDVETRAQYDDLLRRRREHEYGIRCKAQVVKLSEMKVELCEVVKDDDDDDDDDTNDDDDGSTGTVKGADAVQNVYTYPCRCGDMFEILQQDLPQSNNKEVQVPVPSSPSSWSSSSKHVLLECQSCGLSIQIVM